MRFLSPEKSIIVDGHIHAERTPTQGNVMLFGACKVMESVGELAVIDDAQVHVYAAAQHDTGFRLALACNSLDGGLAGKNIHDLTSDLLTSRIVNAHHHINVSYRLTAAAQAARHL